MKRILAPLLVVLLAAAGCSAPATPSAPTATPPETASADATPTPVVMGPGNYTFETVTGAKGTMTIPGRADPEIEGLRAMSPNAPKVTYLTAHVDNRQGSAAVNMSGVSIFTAEGEELKYTSADQYIGAITPNDAPAEVYNQFIAAYNKSNDPANPKGVKDFVLTGPALPKSFTAVKVYPTGASDPVDALPAS